LLIHRNALEVVRLCEKPDDSTTPATTHVFVEEDGRISATDGTMVLRAKGMVEAEPNLFMADVIGVDETARYTLPRDMVADFLKAWGGDQVVVREDGAGAIVETVDGQTSRRFESKSALIDAPNFDHVIRIADGSQRVVIAVDVLLTLARTLKAMGAASVRLSVLGGTAEKHPPAIHVEAKALLGDVFMDVDGALMPMRE
jgi:hypothetical protein